MSPLALNNLAELYDGQGRYAEAEPLYKRALAIREKALGPDHPRCRNSRSTTWPSCTTAQGRYAEAEPLYKRALAIREKALGPDHPDVGNRSTTWPRCTKPRAATPRPSRSSSARSASARRRWAPTTPMVATALNNLAGLYFLQSDWLRAADFWRRSTGVIVTPHRARHERRRPSPDRQRKE